ncbi:MAG: TIGR04086 family membrane protein [bacterium]
MKKYNFFIKNFSLFLTLELFLIIIFSLCNLFGMNTSISSILIFIFNIILFIVFGYIHGKHSNKKGYVSGFLNGVFLSIIMILLNISFFKADFKINVLLYYFLLILSSTLGAMIGKAKKIDEKE